MTCMDDIRVDKNGDLRCANCGGKNFSEKRTRKAKVIGAGAGFATLGVAGLAAPLAAKKKLMCQACGTYNKMGDAQPFEEDGVPQGKTSRTAARTSAPAKKPPSKSDETLGVLLIGALAIGAFLWALNAGSLVWSIITGVVGILILGMVILTLFPSILDGPKRPATPSPQRRAGATTLPDGTPLVVKRPAPPRHSETRDLSGLAEGSGESAAGPDQVNDS